MSKGAKLRSFVAGINMILISLLLFVDANVGLKVASFLLAFTMVISGIRMLWYYFTMARYMVGGFGQLILGAIVLDLGMFTLNTLDEPVSFVILYLLGFHMFSGLVDVLRGLEARKYQAGAWKRSVVSGIINLGIAVVAFCAGFVFQNLTLLQTLYSVGLIYTGILRIGAVFRKNEVVYIQ